MTQFNRYISAFFLFAVFTVALLSCDTENSVEPTGKNYFVKYYGGNGNQSGVDLIEKNDGTFLLLGNWQIDRTENRIYLVNVDGYGRVIWEKKIGTTHDKAKDIEPTSNGNFVILSENTSGTNAQIKLIRISGAGNKIDSIVYGSPGNENPKTVTALTDGGFIITGATEYTEFVVNPVNPDDMSDIFHYRCGSNFSFDVNWRQQYSTGSVEGGTRVVQYSPTLFYVFGFSDQEHPGNPGGNVNLYYYETGASGIAGGYNFLGDYDNDTEASYVLVAREELGGGFFISGTETTSSGSVNLHVSKLREPLTFSLANDEIFDRSIPIESRKLTSLGATDCIVGTKGYLLTANETQNDGTNNIWLTKIDDRTGSVLWSTTFGSEEEDDLAGAALELSDGRILLLGTVGLVNNQSKMVVMKLNSTGQLMD